MPAPSCRPSRKSKPSSRSSRRRSEGCWCDGSAGADRRDRHRRPGLSSRPPAASHRRRGARRDLRPEPGAPGVRRERARDRRASVARGPPRQGRRRERGGLHSRAYRSRPRRTVPRHLLHDREAPRGLRLGRGATGRGRGPASGQAAGGPCRAVQPGRAGRHAVPRRPPVFPVRPSRPLHPPRVGRGRGARPHDPRPRPHSRAGREGRHRRTGHRSTPAHPARRHRQRAGGVLERRSRS